MEGWILRTFWKDEEGTYPLGMFFLLSLIGYLIFVATGNIYLPITFLLVACVCGFFSTKSSFLHFIQEKNYVGAGIQWIGMLFMLALLFSFIQLGAVNGSLGYLKYGGCNGSEEFRNMESLEISQLPGAVPFDGVSYIYFNVVTMTTLGYGDICPQGYVFRWISILEVLIAMAINLIFVTIALGSRDG